MNKHPLDAFTNAFMHEVLLETAKKNTYTHGDFAIILGISNEAVSRIFNGKYGCSRSTTLCLLSELPDEEAMQHLHNFREKRKQAEANMQLAHRNQKTK